MIHKTKKAKEQSIEQAETNKWDRKKSINIVHGRRRRDGK